MSQPIRLLLSRTPTTFLFHNHRYKTAICFREQTSFDALQFCSFAVVAAIYLGSNYISQEPAVQVMKFNTSTFMLRLAVGVVLFSCEVSFVLGHGFCSAPRVRGAYYTQRPVGNLASEKELGGKFDYCPHCRNAGGVGTLRNAGGNVDESGFWIPYEPLKGKFRNGATLCGDPAGQNDHSASGIFRAPDFKPFAAQYKPGSIASFEYDLTTPHGGYLEFYLCDVGDGDIERSQFTSGKCMQLERAAVEECESGYDSQCGPIDPNFKGRFYLPCRQSPSLDQDQIVGGSNGKMSYKIPNVAIRNGVIQMFVCWCLPVSPLFLP